MPDYPILRAMKTWKLTFVEGISLSVKMLRFFYFDFTKPVHTIAVANI